MNDLIQSSFDYAALPVDAAITARAAAERIKMRLKLAVEDIIEIGRELTAVKEQLPHGSFLPWIAAEFEMSADSAQRFISVASRFGEIPQIAVFRPSVIYALSAPSTPAEVIDRAVEKAEAGEKVTVADVKDWRAELDAERQARLVAEQRSEEFRSESNERRKTIRDLQEKIDLLESQPKLDPIIVNVIPDDYESAKADLERLKKQLAEIQESKDRAVQQQVVAKLKEREQEIANFEHQAQQLKGTIEDYQAHIAKIHLPELEMQQQIKVVEEFMRACAGLAAGLAMFEHVPNAQTASVWRKAIAAANDAGCAMLAHVDRRPELKVIHGT